MDLSRLSGEELIKTASEIARYIFPIFEADSCIYFLHDSSSSNPLGPIKYNKKIENQRCILLSSILGSIDRVPSAVMKRLTTFAENEADVKNIFTDISRLSTKDLYKILCLAMYLYALEHKAEGSLWKIKKQVFPKFYFFGAIEYILNIIPADYVFMYGDDSQVHSVMNKILKDAGLVNTSYIEKISESDIGNVMYEISDSIPSGQMYSSPNNESLMLEKIVKKGSKWQVQSEKGRNMGTYDTKGEAEDRLRQVHYFKHKSELTEKSGETKNKYKYKGPLFIDHKLWAAEWEGETYAESLAKAISNLLFQAKHQCGLKVNVPLSLMNDRVEQISFDTDVVDNKKYCPNCGNVLTDGGYCPWCDHNDPDFDPSRKVESMEMKNLSSNTPYMLNDKGYLADCGDIHPYIKVSDKYELSKNIKELLNHKDFIPWFYDNTQYESTKELIVKFLSKALASGFEEAKQIADRLDIELLKDVDASIEDLFVDLSKATNDEFCKVRTSNIRYKYGGDNGEIYFRIPSDLSKWFDFIWLVVFKYQDYITNITIVKDSGTMLQPFSVTYCTINGKEIKHYPIDDFLALGSNPKFDA